MIEEIRTHHPGDDKQQIEEFLIKFTKSDMATKKAMLKQLKVHAAEVILTKKERKNETRVP